MKTAILISGAVIGLLLVAAGTFLFIVIYDRQSYRELAENIEISREWTEIPLTPSLRIEKQIQNVSLIVEGARTTASNKQETYRPDGAVIAPEVELRNSNGTWVPLRSGSFTVNDFDSNSNTFAAKSIDFTLQSEYMPKSTEFVSVRVRSAEPFVCKRVRWHVYNMK